MWKQEYLKPFQFEDDEQEEEIGRKQCNKMHENNISEEVKAAYLSDAVNHIARDQRYMP